MKFRDKYWFLSNMYPCRIQSQRTGLVFTCTEAAFQAMKCPSRASVKVNVMRKILQAKFADERLMGMLKAIEEEIVEDNIWGDTFWGRCNGRGQNMLGKLLMEIRDEPCKGDERR